MKWNILHKEPVKSTDDLIEVLLKNREIADPERFLHPVPPDEIKSKHVGIDSKQLQSAAARIQTAVEKKETVLIYGDYDADGISAATIVWLTLKHLGLTAIPFIPDREKHGYGLAVKALKELKDEHDPDLVISVDNGIVAFEALEWAQKNDLDVIVTDHHQPQEELPPAEAIVHSTQISGAAAAWFLMRELAPDYALSLIDLVAVATITDMMPLTQANRSFVKYGFRALRNSQRAGFKALYQVAKIEPKSVSTYSVGFLIGPRINAAGRISKGIEAMRLLCTGNLAAANKIACGLDKINQQRQNLTEEHLELALEQSDKFKDQKLIFVSSEEFHEGIIGLLAGKLTEKFYKPAIVVAENKKTLKGSARSVKGVNITEMIREVDDLLLSSGGHELAAGFSAQAGNLTQLQQKLEQIAQENISDDLLEREIDVDLLLDPELLTIDTVKSLYSLAPYGIGNRAPVFGLEQVKVLDAKTMGKENNHLRLSLQVNGDDYQTLRAVGWNLGQLAKELKKDQKVNAAFKLEINTWQGQDNLQLNLKDLQTEED